MWRTLSVVLLATKIELNAALTPALPPVSPPASPEGPALPPAAPGTFLDVVLPAGQLAKYLAAAVTTAITDLILARGDVSSVSEIPDGTTVIVEGRSCSQLADAGLSTMTARRELSASMREAATLPAEVIATVDKMAEFKVRNGEAFESIIKEKQSGSSKFDFLFDSTSPAHAYYKSKVDQLQASSLSSQGRKLASCETEYSGTGCQCTWDASLQEMLICATAHTDSDTSDYQSDTSGRTDSEPSSSDEPDSNPAGASSSDEPDSNPAGEVDESASESRIDAPVAAPVAAPSIPTP